MNNKIGRTYTENCSEQELIGQIGFPYPVKVDRSLRKKILITGAKSYIGESFAAYASKNYRDNFEIDTLDMLDGSWREYDFSQYDIVYHVAGIAHADVGNVSDEVKKRYYEVNTDLALEVCQKAKEERVSVFIFMSSMIVYGDSAPYGKQKIITDHTVPVPANFYGDSKLQADVGVRQLADENFQVLVLRPPMIYGKGSKGNYPILSKLAKLLPIFPDVKNLRSMLHIDNLCEFLCQIMLAKPLQKMIVDIESHKDYNGIILIPQNKQWIRTTEMVSEIAHMAGKSIHTMKLLAPAVWIGSKIPGKVSELVNKAFGNNCYAHKISIYEGINYQKVNFEQSIQRTECHFDKPKRALMLASVASMIDLFNTDNIDILLKLGYQVDVATNFEEGSITSQEHVDQYRRELKRKGIGTYQIPIPRSISKILDIIRSYFLVKKLVERKHYQIVHCHSPIGGVVCRLACRNVRKNGTKVIYTAHGFHFFKGASKKAWAVFYPIEKLCSVFTDVLITINREDYKRAKTFYANKVCYVPGIGVHTDEIQNISVDRLKKRKEFSLKETDFVLMSTGQISERKNHEVVIKALAKLSNPRIKYLIVGFGELEEKLKDLVKTLHLDNQVIFAGYRDDVKELLHIVDAFVFPSLQEGLPVSLMEAMAAGLPVVCSKIRGNVDLIENGKGGYLYEPYDIDGFAEGINRVLSRENLKMGTFNKRTMHKFDTYIVNKKMCSIYKKCSRD